MKRIRRHDLAINITLGSIAVIIISSALSNIIPLSATAKENLKEYEVLKKMTEVDGIAHQWDALLHTLGSGYNPTRDRLFHVTDNKYHTAQYQDDKFKAAQDLNKLVMDQNTFIQQLGKETPEQKKMFEQLEENIEYIELNPGIPDPNEIHEQTKEETGQTQPN